MQCNPLVVNGVLYATSPKLNVVALDAESGRLRWRFDATPGVKIFGAQRSRGLTYWTDGTEQRIFVAARHDLYALNAATGRPIESFGNSGRIDLRENLGRNVATQSVTLSSPGIIHKDLLIVGGVVSETLPSSPGDVRAYDVRTGQLRWSFHTIPNPGELGHATWPSDAWQRSGGANSWAGMSLDERRGIVFVPTGSAALDYYGGDRVGDNLFANSLIALDAMSGKRLWHFQFVHHDVLDRDLPAQPSLVTVRRGGRSVAAVAQVTKTGHVFVFDRTSGKPLFPIEEVRVPASGVDGEVTSATQPLPSRPAPFVRQLIGPELLTRRTPQAHDAVLERFSRLRSGGPFEPPSLAGTVVFPGLDGGAEWGGAAFDPASSMLYVNANEMPYIVRLAPGGPQMEGVRTGQQIYAAECSGCHGADLSGSPPHFPSLLRLIERLGPTDLFQLLLSGSGRMPAFGRLGFDGIHAVTNYVLYGTQVEAQLPLRASENLKYTLAGIERFTDPDGYPAVQPPWGTLSALDLNKGRLVWQIPLGEYPDLTEHGLNNTGSENYGGPIVTAGGLLFIGATSYDAKFRAFDARTGALLWETTLPAAGHATPATYMAGGKQFVVVAAGGGKTSQRSGGSYVAFALP